MNSEEERYKTFHSSPSIAEALFRLFVNRTDTYAVQLKNGAYIRIDKPLTRDVLEKHLAGEVTVGSYTVNPADQSTKYLCFDVDPETSKDPEADVRSLLKACEGRFPREAVLLEASRFPDPSYHVWVFFNPPMPAKVARFLGRKILEHAGVTCEVFPKQDIVKPGEYGNLVKLPLGLHQKEGKRSVFLNPETLKPVGNQVLLEVEGCFMFERDIQQAMILADVHQAARPGDSQDFEIRAKTEADLYRIPCVRAFMDQSIPPGMRHNVIAKNFAILYWKARGSWEGFEEWAEKLAANKPQFSAKDITGWKSWVEASERKLNCTEIRRFLLKYVPGFVCNGSCFKWQQRSYRAFLRRVEKL